MKKLTFFLFLIISIVSCKKDDGCIDESLKHNNPCIKNARPVCGCDGITYVNSCYAEREGITLWTDGECK